MAEAPKIPELVRARLRQQQVGVRPAIEHPDADLLAAYSENSLSGRERSLLLNHLAVCEDCREIVTLAQPEPSEAAASSASSARRVPGWMMLRWAALAACFVLTIGVVILNRSFREAAVSQAPSTTEQPRQAEQLAEADQQQKRGEAVEAVNAESFVSKDSFTEGKTKKRGFVQGSVGRAFGGAAGYGQVNTPPSAAPARADKLPLANKEYFAFGKSAANAGVTQRSKEQAPGTTTVPIEASAPAQAGARTESITAGKAEASPASPKPDVATDMFYRSRQATTQPSRSVGAFSDADGVSTLADRQSSRMDLQEQAPGKKKVADEEARPAASTSATVAAPRVRESQPATAAASPVRSQTSNFETKQNAPETEALTVNGQRLAVNTPTPLRWRIRQGKLQQSTDDGKNWQQVNVAPGVSLHAFWSQGSTVWAGGTGGSLFHITEDGKQSVRIPIKIGEGDISQTVVAVTFSDELHGIVTLENGQILQTADGGKTWERH